MNDAFKELKIIARKRQQDTDLALTEVQQQLARQLGFKSWQHAKQQLEKDQTPTDDWGTLFYNRHSGAFLNKWCRNREEADALFSESHNAYLLPYKTQFIVAESEYIKALTPDENDLSLWNTLNRDATQKNAPEWQHLCASLIRQRLS